MKSACICDRQMLTRLQLEYNAVFDMRDAQCIRMKVCGKTSCADFCNCNVIDLTIFLIMPSFYGPNYELQKEFGDKQQL